VVVVYRCVRGSSLAHYDVDSVLDRWDLSEMKRQAMRYSLAFVELYVVMWSSILRIFMVQFLGMTGCILTKTNRRESASYCGRRLIGTSHI
jgi:hypothetical protein